ncbi:hypothetical protein E2C01_068386 [Portunus trituberculatus]|uniref:Uncharacterized protein n=1 Tax=Portunus trituberculatus TaxID=210409 RepID=A0A5B7HM92_PORTR|nr:hypothetical protein [Portunus trituberculatus]
MYFSLLYTHLSSIFSSFLFPLKRHIIHLLIYHRRARVLVVGGVSRAGRSAILPWGQESGRECAKRLRYMLLSALRYSYLRCVYSTVFYGVEGTRLAYLQNYTMHVRCEVAVMMVMKVSMAVIAVTNPLRCINAGGDASGDGKSEESVARTVQNDSRVGLDIIKPMIMTA